MIVLRLKMVLSCGGLSIAKDAPAAPWKSTSFVWRAERGFDEGAAMERGRRRERVREMIMVFIMDDEKGSEPLWMSVLYFF